MSAQWRNRILRYGVENPQDILANSANWRTHNQFQQTALGEVLTSVGWIQDVVINLRTQPEWGLEQNKPVLVDGHLRVQLAVQVGEIEVPVKYVDLSPAEEALVLATLDPLGALAGTDATKLKENLDAIKVSFDFASDSNLNKVFDALSQTAQTALATNLGLPQSGTLPQTSPPQQDTLTVTPRDTERWEERRYVLSMEQAKIVDSAINSIVAELDGDNRAGRALEFLAAEYLAK